MAMQFSDRCHLLHSALQRALLRITLKDISCIALWVDGTAGQPCADALFKFVDSDDSGSLTYKEITSEIKAYRSMTTADAKLQVLFGFYDQNHDGKISLSELAAAMKMACQALPESQLNQIEKLSFLARGLSIKLLDDSLASATMEEFDVDKDGFLNFAEFSALIRKSGLELNV